MSEQINGQPVAPTPPVATPTGASIGVNTNVQASGTTTGANQHVATLIEGEAKTFLSNIIAEIRALADKLEAGIK